MSSSPLTRRCRYSVLAALDHFRDVTLLERTTPDPRLLAWVDVVRAARATDGTWRQGTQLPGRTWCDVDVPAVEASKWLTLLGTRVLDWWDGAS